MKKSDLTFILTPFVLTALLVAIGYQILITQTPQARISLPPEQTQIEILEDGNIEKVLPKVPIPEKLVMAIQPVPNNRAQLAQLIKLSLDEGATAIYLSLPVNINPDHSLELTGVHASSEENITRWAKKSISTAHKNGLHVIFTVTLNANEVITDSRLFSQNYTLFVKKWSKLATEYGVTFFNTGITLGHPLYSKFSQAEMSGILRASQNLIRQHYSGNLGVSLCCVEEIPIPASGYTFLMVIPTGEHPVATLAPLASTLKTNHNMSRVFLYDRERQRVTDLDLTAN